MHSLFQFFAAKKKQTRSKQGSDEIRKKQAIELFAYMIFFAHSCNHFFVNF